LLQNSPVVHSRVLVLDGERNTDLESPLSPEVVKFGVDVQWLVLTLLLLLFLLLN